MKSDIINQIDQHVSTVSDPWRELSRVAELKGWDWLKPMTNGKDYLRLAYLAAYLDDKVQDSNTL